ncbi:hypothetical protein ACNKHX_26600 [Shigella flexneri]
MSGRPEAVLNYIKRIEELTGVPIDTFSLVPYRTVTMICAIRSTRNFWYAWTDILPALG